jgi:hypothetical protein
MVHVYVRGPEDFSHAALSHLLFYPVLVVEDYSYEAVSIGLDDQGMPVEGAEEQVLLELLQATGALLHMIDS